MKMIIFLRMVTVVKQSDIAAPKISVAYINKFVFFLKIYGQHAEIGTPSHFYGTEPTE